MKKLVSIFALSVCCILIVNTTSAAPKKGKNTVFQCEVKYSIKYTGNIDPQKLAQLPTESTYKVFGNKRRTTTNIGIPLHIIYDGDSCRLIQLIDAPGQQMAIVRDKSFFEEKREGVSFIYEATNDTKTICGYVCNGYKVTLKDADEDESEELGIVYTSSEILPGTAGNYFEMPGLEGFPMYMEITSNGVTTVTEVTAINTKVKVSLADYLVPSSYKILTDEEIEKIFGGSQGGDEDDF